MKKLINLIIYCIIIVCPGLLLISCSQQDILTLLTTDNLPPNIVSVTPTNNETKVPVDTSIEIIFSEEMDIDSTIFAFNFFKIIPGGETALSGSTEWEESRILTFTSNSEQDQFLDYLTEYRIYISEAAKDKNGNNLEQSFNSTFLTIGNFSVALGNRHTLFLD